MEKKKAKAILSIVLTLVLLAGNAGLFFPKLTANAASDTYYVKITWTVTNRKGDAVFEGNYSENAYAGKSGVSTSSNDNNCTGLSLFYKANNGTADTEKEAYWDFGTANLPAGGGASSSTGGCWKEATFTATATISGFPTRLFGILDGQAAGGTVAWNVSKIEIGASASSTLTTLWAGTVGLETTYKCYYFEISPTGVTGNANGGSSTTSNTWSSCAPAVSSLSLSGSSSVKIPASGASTTSNYTAAIVDQYGVNWTASNPSWSTSSANTTISNSGKTGTVTFKNATLDYSTTVKASLAGKSDSVTVTVLVPHTITVNPNGGTYNNTASNTTYTGKYTGDTVTISNPVRTGYTFNGWSIAATNGTVSTLSATTLTVKNGNSTLTAKWTPNDYTLHFNANGGAVDPADKTVSYDAAVGELPVPTRTGYDFLGWFTAASGGELITATELYTTAADSTVFAHWSPNNDALVFEKTVLDFGQPVVIDVLDQETVLKADAVAAVIAGVGGAASEPSDALAEGFSSSYTAASGTFTVNDDNTVTFTPSGFLSEPQTAYVAVLAQGKYIYSPITIVPATVVYYEDDYSGITYSGAWTTLTDENNDMPEVSEETADTVYGYSDIYAANTSKYSMSAAKIVTVDQNCVERPCAQFTFSGTGFDIISLISKDTGAIEVKVYEGAGTSGMLAYDWIVDTYYTYKTEENPDTQTNWEPDHGSTAALYQIPVIGRSDLSYGTYTVQILPTYSSRLDHEKDGAYDFYLDAVRIYNPCGDNAEANAVYAADGEKLLVNRSAYDLLTALAADGTAAGAVFINTNTTDASLTDYKSIGPKNEVYLQPGQAIAFCVSCLDTNAKVRISVHSADGNPVHMRLGRESGSYTETILVKSSTTLYYNVPVEWNDGSGLVVIANTSGGILSVCDIRVTTSTLAATTADASFAAIGEEASTQAAALARTMAALSLEDDGLFVPGEVSSEEMTEAVISGNTASVRITTTTDVDRLTINGEEAVCTGEEDGNKIWAFSFTAGTASGEETLEIVAFDAYGYASETTTMTVEVQSRMEYFFSNLVKIIRAIVEFLQTLANAVQS